MIQCYNLIKLTDLHFPDCCKMLQHFITGIFHKKRWLLTLLTITPKFHSHSADHPQVETLTLCELEKITMLFKWVNQLVL
jgi:hypothetical protein